MASSHVLKLKAVLDSSDVQNKLNQLRQTQNKTLGQNGTVRTPALGNLPSLLSQLNTTLRQLNQNIQKLIGPRGSVDSPQAQSASLGLLAAGLDRRPNKKNTFINKVKREIQQLLRSDDIYMTDILSLQPPPGKSFDKFEKQRRDKKDKQRYLAFNELIRTPIADKRYLVKRLGVDPVEYRSSYFDPITSDSPHIVRRPSKSYPGRTGLSYDNPYGRNRSHTMSNWVRWGIGSMVAGQILGAWEQSFTSKQRGGFRPIFTDALQGSMMGSMAGGFPGAALGLLFGAGTGVIRANAANRVYLQSIAQENTKNIQAQQRKEELWLEQNRAIRIDQKRERNQRLYGNFSIDQYGNIEDPERFTEGLKLYSREIPYIQEKIYNLGDLDTLEKQNEYFDLKDALDYEMAQKQKLLDLDKKALEIRKAYKKQIEEEISLQQLEINAQLQAAFIINQQNVLAQGGNLYDYSSFGLYDIGLQNRINQAKNTKTNLWGNFQKYSNQAKSYRKSYGGLLSDIESRSLIAQDENEIQALNNLKNEAEQTKQKLNEASQIATIFGNAEISRLQNLLTNLIAPDQTQVTSLASSGKFIHNQNDNDKWSEHINYLQTQTKLQREIRDKVKEMDSYSTFN